MKEELIKKFYQGLIFNSIAVLIFLIIVIVLVLARNKFLIRFQYSEMSKIIFFAITLFFFLISGIFAVKTSLYLKDYNSVKNEDFNTITGIVVDYGKVVSVGDIATENKYYFPIVKDLTSDFKIKLDCQGTTINETYTFLYLENTKLAIIVND